MEVQKTETYDLNELSRLGAVTVRTIRFYIQQGLLPPPLQSGPGAKYGDTHLHRLRAIRRLQRRHLPLADIRQKLAAMTESEVAGMAEGPSSASAYLGRVMGNTGAYEASEVTEPSPAPSRSIRFCASKEPVPQVRAQWDRYTLVNDVEPHVRRPLSREMNRRVERLLDAARSILSDDDDLIGGGT